ncbi:hypothetical protein [Butyrivibrio fibrisolvens]|uniref:hypothetical protein n=1 Tax=Butyrivibrio fibrisolvens TaxID=831 RepID=UPI00040C342F|nr:hypothetical protein [Butyrivibrio fibrisolvens]
MSEEIQEPNTPNKLSTKKSLILGCIIFCLGLLVIEAIKINYQVTNKYGSWGHYWEHVRLNREKPKLAEELDAARDAYKYTVENSVLYMIRDGDYVESVTAEVVYDDIRSAETTTERIGSWCNLDKAYVTVQLDTSFNSIPDLDKCNMLLKIQDEIEHNLSELYYGSSSGSYDPYDVHDYDSADDFADDKYEEFYDYEDEYEDEDEAYDAAEDYWYDEY